MNPYKKERPATKLDCEYTAYHQASAYGDKPLILLKGWWA